MQKNVDIYLRNAFRELEAFSVPGIGTFRKVYDHARLDAQQQQAFPPEVRLTFEPVEDPMVSLRRYLERKLMLSEEAATRILADIQAVIQGEVAEKGSFDLPEIGRLYRATATNKLAFEAAHTSAVAGDFFGFIPVPLHESHLETAPPMTATPQAAAPRNWTSSWRPVVLVLLLGAMGYLLFTQGPFTKSRSSLTQGLQVRFDPPPSAAAPVAPDSLGPVLSDGTAPASEMAPSDPDRTSLRQAPGTPGDQGAPRGAEGEAGFDESISISVLDTAQQSVPAPTERGTSLRTARTFHLIGGSFSTQRAAERYAQEMRAENLSPIILFPPAGSSLTYRVSLFSHTSRQQVEAFAERLKRQGKKAGWIYEEIPQP